MNGKTIAALAALACVAFVSWMVTWMVTRYLTAK